MTSSTFSSFHGEENVLSEGKKKVVVVGQGYVGLPLAMAAVGVGYQVIGYDTSTQRIEMLQSGNSFIEDISNEQLQAALAQGRYVPTAVLSDCCDFDVAVITVPTPLKDRLPDLDFIESAALDIGTCLTRGALVILESTTYPGTTEELFKDLLEKSSGLSAGTDFKLGYSPERIDPGNPVWHFENTPKVVSGIDGPSLEAVDEFYSGLVEKTVRVSTTRVAELCKLLENTFRHVNIALVNELAMFASALDADVWEAINASSTKPFGFMRFTPGPGVGGHCLPVDPSYLSWKVQQSTGELFRFVNLANEVNEHMPKYTVQRVGEILNRDKKPVNGSRILVCGLAYKKNSSDFRESPSLVVCELLTSLGAEVRVADAWVPEGAKVPWNRVPLNIEEMKAADLVLILTDHDDVDYAEIRGNSKLIFDTRHCVAVGDNVEYL